LEEQKKHKKRKLQIVLIVLVGSCVLLYLIPFRYFPFLTRQAASEIRQWISVWDSPETVAVKMLNACRDGDLKTVSELLSSDSRNLLFTRAALADPVQTPEDALKKFAGKNQLHVKDAVFKAKRDPLSPPEETGRIRVIVQVFPAPAESEKAEKAESVPESEIHKEPKALFELPVNLVKEPSGWKCDCLD